MVIKVLGTAVSIFALTSCNYAMAKLPSSCEYEKVVKTNWTQHIEKTSNITEKVFPYVDDTRKCVITMDVTIDGIDYPTDGEYVFGPDMTQNAACGEAVIKAKKKIITQVSPEVLTAQTEMICNSDTAVTQNKDVIVTTETTPTVIQGTVIQGKTIDNRPTVVIQSNNNNFERNLYDPTFSIWDTFFGQPKSQPYLDPRQPRCKAKWNTGGRTCWYD